METIVSGMRPTGRLHLGHLHGALKNWLKLQEQYQCYFFVADWHALTTDYASPQGIQQSTIDMVMDWLSIGLDPAKSVLFRQSRVKEHAELHLLYSMITPVPWLERNPTYKEQLKEIVGKDLSTYGFLGYPVLQAADITIYKANKVPVGVDQAPHVELTREIVRRFNQLYQPIFPEPEVLLTETQKMPGLDGRKMSKSYGNVIPLFAGEKELRKVVMKIKTNSLEPGQPKDPTDSALFEIYRAFASDAEAAGVRERYAAGIGWGEMKQVLFERINAEIAPARAEYERLMAAPTEVERLLKAGAEKARAVSEPFLAQIRDRVGIRPLAR
jgi:tryptophanyl-tRNA synthetase